MQKLTPTWRGWTVKEILHNMATESLVLNSVEQQQVARLIEDHIINLEDKLAEEDDDDDISW